MRKFLLKILHWLKKPSGWGVALITLLFGVLLSLTIMAIRLAPRSKVHEIFSYLLYGATAVLLSYLVYVIVLGIKQISERLNNHKGLLGRLKLDYEFRTLIFAIGSGLFAAVVSAYYFTLFSLTFSLWFGALAGYYLVLVLTRGWVLLSRATARRRRENADMVKLRDAKSYFGSGVMLVLLAYAFAGVLVLTVVRGFHKEYVGLTIFVAALYAFLKISFAIYNFFKANRREDFTVRTLRNVNTADALVSIIALQAAMLQKFIPQGSPLDAHAFNAVTGAVVFLLILGMGTYMIARGHRRMKMLQTRVAPEGEEDGEGEEEGKGKEKGAEA